MMVEDISAGSYYSDLSLVPTSDVSDVSGIVSGIGIGRTLRSSGNQNDVSDGSRSVVGRKRKPSDPSDYDSVELPIPIVTPFFSDSGYVAGGNQLLIGSGVGSGVGSVRSLTF